MTLGVAILAFFTGAMFRHCGCECHEDDGRDDLDLDELEGAEPYLSYEVA